MQESTRKRNQYSYVNTTIISKHPTAGPTEHRRWTYMETILLRKLWENTLMSCTEIGKELDRTRNSVIGKIHRLRIKRSKLKYLNLQRSRGITTRIIHQPEPPPPPINARDCLKCRQSFYPTHKGNFICSPCTHSNRSEVEHFTSHV